jgi:ribose transport system substrate-binding protein
VPTEKAKRPPKGKNSPKILLACSFGLSTAAHAAGLLIGFSQVTLPSPFYVELKEGAEAAAKSGGDQLIFLDANGDVTNRTMISKT